MKLDRAQTQAKLTHIARRMTGLDIVVSTSEYNGKDGWKAYGKGTCAKHPNSYTLHIAQSLEGESLVEPMRKGMAACMKGDQHKETNMLSNGRGKTNKDHLDTLTVALDMRTQCKDKADQTTNREAIINCGHAAVVKGEKVARGNNGVVKTVTYTGSNGVGGTCNIKPDVDFIVGNKVTKWVAVCADGREFTFAADEEQLKRAQNQAAEIQARADSRVAKLEAQLKKVTQSLRAAEDKEAKIIKRLADVA